MLERQLLPWADLRDNEVVITTSVINELKDVVGDIGGLKSLAELLGWRYEPRRSIREGKRVTSRSVAVVSLEEFIEFLAK